MANFQVLFSAEDVVKYLAGFNAIPDLEYRHNRKLNEEHDFVSLLGSLRLNVWYLSDSSEGFDYAVTNQ